MSKIREITVTITYMVFCILAIYFVLLVKDIRVLVLHADSMIPQVNSTLSSIQAIETNTTRTEAELSGLLNTTRHIALAEQKSQDDQLQQIRLLSIKAGMMIDDADVTIKQIGQVAPYVALAVQNTSDDIHTTLYSSQRLIEATTDDVSSPSIRQTMDNIQEASKNTVETTSNVDAATKDIKDYIHRETTPVRGTWNFVKELINLTWSVRGAAGL